MILHHSVKLEGGREYCQLNHQEGGLSRVGRKLDRKGVEFRFESVLYEHIMTGTNGNLHFVTYR